MSMLDRVNLGLAPGPGYCRYAIHILGHSPDLISVQGFMPLTLPLIHQSGENSNIFSPGNRLIQYFYRNIPKSPTSFYFVKLALEKI